MTQDRSVSLPNVAILLCTHNGARFLPGQLESFETQSLEGWVVWASDDASDDETRDILETYRRKWGEARLSVRAGPSQGFTKNFLSLICAADMHADYYAFADQDDVWERDKLARAVSWLQTVPSDVPALYCSRTRLIDEDGRDAGLSPLLTRFRPRFANALVQSLAGGNTMVLNGPARRLLTAAGPDVTIVSHDWWAYQLVTGCGGRVTYDPHPAVRYRQHGRQLVGNNVAWRARMSRLAQVFQGRFRRWSEINIRAIDTMYDHLTPENQRTLELMRAVRQGGVMKRLAALRRSGLHRQSIADNVGLHVAVLLNRL